jgi:hypothetical protein
MKTIPLFIFLCLILSLSGCSRFYRVIFGIHKPVLENEASLKSYAFGIGLDTSNMFAVRYRDYFNVASRRGFPDALIFNSSGGYIEYKRTDTSCNAGLFSFIPQLNKDSNYIQSDTFRLNNEIYRFRTLSGQPVQSFDTASYDFLLCIYWARFLGNININHVAVWQQMASANPNATIKTILVNLDVQQNWETPQRDELLYAMRKAIR